MHSKINLFVHLLSSRAHPVWISHRKSVWTHFVFFVLLISLQARNKGVAVVFTVPEENDNLNDNNDENDMVAAEDIIFRPLFRYRQQENERTRIMENRAYRRNSYDRYRTNNNAYRSRQNNPYRRPQRTRYYDDYDS